MIVFREEANVNLPICTLILISQRLTRLKSNRVAGSSHTERTRAESRSGASAHQRKICISGSNLMKLPPSKIRRSKVHQNPHSSTPPDPGLGRRHVSVVAKRVSLRWKASGTPFLVAIVRHPRRSLRLSRGGAAPDQVLILIAASSRSSVLTFDCTHEKITQTTRSPCRRLPRSFGRSGRWLCRRPETPRGGPVRVGRRDGPAGWPGRLRPQPVRG